MISILSPSTVRPGSKTSEEPDDEGKEVWVPLCKAYRITIETFQPHREDLRRRHLAGALVALPRVGVDELVRPGPLVGPVAVTREELRQANSLLPRSAASQELGGTPQDLRVPLEPVAHLVDRRPGV